MICRPLLTASCSDLIETVNVSRSVAALRSGHAFGNQPFLDQRQIVGDIDPRLAVPADLGLDLRVALARIVGFLELGIELLNFTLHLNGHYVAFALVA